MSEEYKMQRIKEYLIFHIKDGKERKELLDYLDQLQQKENIIKEVRKWVYENQCKFTRDDEIVVSEVSFNINAKPCELLEILDKENK